MPRQKTGAIPAALLAALICMAIPGHASAYGLDGLFGGRPNPDGSIEIEVPQAEDRLSPDRAQSVLAHPRPDYDPLPLRFGDFLVTPAVEAGIAYDSNIYAAPRGAADQIYDLSPAVTVASDWNRHYLGLIADGDFNFYQDHDQLDTKNALVQLNGRYDMIDHMALGGSAGYQMQTVPRWTLNNTNGSVPTTFNLYKVNGFASRDAGLVGLTLGYDFGHYDYSRAAGFADYSMFDRNENAVSGKVSYDAGANFKPYLGLQYNARSYDSGGMNNSQGYRADIGGDWDFGGITSLNLYTGWLSQDYASYGASPVNQGLDFGGKLTWNVTPLTTVTLDADRSVQEALIAGYNSFMASGGSAAVTHELRRNILLEGDLSYTADDYQGLAKRQDDVPGAAAGMRYLIDRNLYADMKYSWTHRSSDAENEGYVDHTVMAKIGLQF